MKKSFFIKGLALVASLLLAGCSNIAVDSSDNGAGGARAAGTLNASSVSTGTYTSNKTSGNYTILATSAKPVAVRSNSVSIGGTSYKTCIDLKGGFSGTKPTYRAVQLSANKGDVIKVVANAGADRTLQISNGSSVVKSATVGTSGTTVSYTTTASGTFYIYSKASAIYLYSVTATAGSSSSSSSGSSSGSSSSGSSSSGSGSSSSSVSKITLYKGSSTVGTYSSVKSAVSAVGSSGSYTIVIPKGTYNEQYIYYNGSASITIRGNTSSYGDVVIKGHGSNMKTEKGRELMELSGSCNVVLMNLTLQSDYSRKDHSGEVQAEVLGFDSKGTLAAYNCAFKGHQDTLRTAGKAWFYKCYVEGDVDFIWMESAGIVALYENCTIQTLYDSYASYKESYICAPRMTKASTVGKGVVLLNCSIKCASGQKNYLFRNPWGDNSNYYNQCAVVNCSVSGTLYGGYNKATGTGDQQYIGYKIDSTTAGKLSSKSNVTTMSSSVKNEYSGRRAILNRRVNTSGQFSKDSSVWDIDSTIKNNNMSVSTDNSSAG